MITVTILSLCFLTAISCKIKKVKAHQDLIRLLWYVHLVLLFFSALCVLMMLGGYGFKGAYTERVFLTLYAGTGVILYGLTPQQASGKWVYLLCFFGFPFVLLFGLLLPPLRILTIMAGVALLFDGHVHRYPIDDDYTLETRDMGILSRYPAYNLVVDKYGFFEKTTPDVVSKNYSLQALQTAQRSGDSIKISILAFDQHRMRFDTTIALQ